METTFGLPFYQFPNPLEAEAQLMGFVHDALAESAEVVWRANEGFSKIPLPDAIHNDARCQWMVRARHPAGQLQSPAFVVQQRFAARREDGWKLARNLASQRDVAAPNVNLEVLWLSIRHGHHQR